MFSKEEIKRFIVKLGEKWFFPNFSNKITWYVVTLGAGFILVPAPVKLFFINWLIDVFNLNSGINLKLPELEASTDYSVGLILIISALIHNVGYNFFELENEKYKHKIASELRISDYKLLEQFLEGFPSDSESAILLRDHDFGNSFKLSSFHSIIEFIDKWNGAEYRFMNKEIEQKKQNLYKKCKDFYYKVAEYTSPVGTSNLTSVIPDHIRGNWDWPDWVIRQYKELNEMASKVYQEHQDFIVFAKGNL